MQEDISMRLDHVNADIALLQRKNGLTYGTDALLLASYIQGAFRDALELGSGTGIISLLLLKREKVKSVTALEVQADFAEITAKNAEINGQFEKMHVICCDLRDYNDLKKYDLVFSNPPYMKCDSGKRNTYDDTKHKKAY